MKGGKRIYEERLREFNSNHEGNNPYPHDGRFELIRSLQKYNRAVEGVYFPQRLENFSPYREDHKYRNLIQAERDIISGIEQTEPINRIPLKKAEQLLQYKLNQALGSLDNKIYIFRLTTGIGKSWRIKDLDDVTIAFPTNDLKQELYRERKYPTTAVMTPELPTFSDELLNKKLQRLYTLGLGKQAHRLLWDIKKGVYGMGNDQYLARTYLDDSKVARRSIETVFTTHDRAMHTTFGHETIIYDEDPIDKLLQVDTLRIADLKKIEKNANMFGNKELSILDLQRYLEDVEEDRILEFPNRFEVDIDSHLVGMLYARDIESNIMEYLQCDYFYKDPNDRDKIHFINTSSFPEDKKIIIMSATIPTFIYKKLFGQRVVEVNISDVTQQGRVTQYTDYSYSRNSLSKRIEEANEKTKGRPTITFKSFNDNIKSASETM
ncbi:hypothetical protein [Fodinibius sp. AD559]|uniref:hypothetical protein n=1 Tax=Fodinibius sp. AD559 TaxID=3424179 RepID=UPI004046A369